MVGTRNSFPDSTEVKVNLSLNCMGRDSMLCILGVGEIPLKQKDRSLVFLALNTGFEIYPCAESSLSSLSCDETLGPLICLGHWVDTPQ